jgi:hypothetical protein
VSRLDNPTPTSVLQKSSWKPPVIVTEQQSNTAFTDKEQIWADNASSSPFFGRTYACFAEFRSNGHHNPGTEIAPLTVSTSADGGDTWRTTQIQPADAGGHGQGEFGSSGCTIRTDSHGVAYLFAEMFQNSSITGLPTHGAHVMFKSFDGGAHWSKERTLFRVTDPCSFVDPLSFRCVMDGFTGARTDLAASPSVDIANGAPTGAGATNLIVDAWADASAGLNHEDARVVWSSDGGATWSAPDSVSLAGDRPIYAATAISPSGNRVYLVYEAVTSPWAGNDVSTPRPYHGVFLSAPIGSGGPGAWSTMYNGPLGDLRSSFPPPIPRGAHRRLRLRGRESRLRSRALDRRSQRGGLPCDPGLARAVAGRGQSGHPCAVATSRLPCDVGQHGRLGGDYGLSNRSGRYTRSRNA